jgi:hypothetical protein
MQMASTPIAPREFRYLKHLDIRIHGGILYPAYDFLCLASFLEASPSLETHAPAVGPRRAVRRLSRPRPDAPARPPRRPSLASTRRRLAIKPFRAAPRARTRSTVPSSPRARHCRRHSRAAPPLASGVGQPPLAPLDTLAHPPETQATGRCRRAHRN